MIIEVLPVGPVQCNCVILGCPETREAMVIDPGGDAELILEHLDAHQLQLKCILLTHAHFDHVTAVSKLKAARGAEIMVHVDEKPLYDTVTVQGLFFGIAAAPLPRPDRKLADGDRIKWGNLEGQVRHTPGHSPGSICFYVPQEELLVTGDTLFAQSIGRTDLWGGSLPTLMRSLKEQVLSLPDETRVIPGHGPSTTIGTERRSNLFLQELEA